MADEKTPSDSDIGTIPPGGVCVVRDPTRHRGTEEGPPQDQEKIAIVPSRWDKNGLARMQAALGGVQEDVLGKEAEVLGDIGFGRPDYPRRSFAGGASKNFSSEANWSMLMQAWQATKGSPSGPYCSPYDTIKKYEIPVVAAEKGGPEAYENYLKSPPPSVPGSGPN